MALFPTILTYSAIQQNSTICISNNTRCGFYPVSPHLTSVCQSDHLHEIATKSCLNPYSHHDHHKPGFVSVSHGFCENSYRHLLPFPCISIGLFIILNKLVSIIFDIFYMLKNYLLPEWMAVETCSLETFILNFVDFCFSESVI